MAMESGGGLRPELELGKRIQDFRRQKGLTQQGLCYKAHLSYSTLAKIERGAIRSPSIFTIEAISIALNMSIDELVGLKIPEDKIISKTRNLKESKEGIRFVYFDVNGCLVRFYQKAFSKLAGDIGISSDRIETVFWNYNDRINRGRINLSEFNQLLAHKLGIKELDWINYYLNAVQKVPGMEELITWVSENYKIGLLTNTMPGVINNLIKQTKIPRIEYDAIVDSSVEGYIKPESKIFEIAVSKANLKPSQILLVDDTRANLIAAAKNDWHILWFDYSQPSKSIEEIKELLKFS